jgi:ABC-type lipoprotein export system ATPase subunit
MEIDIKHCNNIDSAKISIGEGKLNIKFAPNGTGKSTISKAIQFASAKDEQALAKLLPFKFREENIDNIKPEVVGVENFDSIMCFDEEYVSKFTFKPDELVSNSFDIFIRTESYKVKEQEIQALTNSVQKKFSDNPELEKFIENLKELSGAFKVTTTGGLSKSSAGMKGLSGGNKIEHIPEGLEPYQPFIQSQKSVTWIDWQAKGHNEFSELSDSCPFCTSDSTDKKEQIAKVSQEYDKNLIKNLIGIIDVIQNLGDYFYEGVRSKLQEISKLKNGLEIEHERFIVDVKAQIDNFAEKLEQLRTLSRFNFNEGENVEEKLSTFKLDLSFFEALNSEKTIDSIKVINESIEVLIEQAGLLQGRINLQRIEVKQLIEKHQKDINAFLTYAGFRYEVAIVGEGENSHLKLRHVDHSSHLSGGDQHLSFGERNAFSIVLFMYECLAKNPSLVILDDPISSFDKNKKYAILEMLFRRDARSCLKSKTVLMLTHDVEPIIDTLKSVRGQFSNQVFAAYLKLRNGEVTELPIVGKDIKTFIQICKTILISNQDKIIKMIYLRRRYEVFGELDSAYQILSNLFKKREEPVDQRIPKDDEGNGTLISPDDLAAGMAEVLICIPCLPDDYPSLVALFCDDARIKALYNQSNNGYEKLQLTRILIDIEAVENSVIRKFINETYHIENEFIFQLDPTQFDLIPEYVVQECDKILAEANG